MMIKLSFRNFIPLATIIHELPENCPLFCDSFPSRRFSGTSISHPRDFGVITGFCPQPASLLALHNFSYAISSIFIFPLHSISWLLLNFQLQSGSFSPNFKITHSNISRLLSLKLPSTWPVSQITRWLGQLCLW